MWQRFQTLLLLIVAGLLLSMFMTDMCYTMVESANGSGAIERYSIKFTERSQFLIFTFITFVLTVATISYFKKRLIQIRICIMNALILMGYQIWLIVTFFQLHETFTFTIPCLFPLISVVLLLLAIRYIGRDEAMVIINGNIVKHKKNKRKS